MTFFTRPNLDNIQFKQLEGSVLTLSGQTQIATTSGFTLTDGSGGNVIITASGSSISTVGYVLGQDTDGIIKLLPSAASGSSNYYGSSPTTCSIGGLSAGTSIYGTSVQDILQCMLAPTIPPLLQGVSISSFTISPTTTLYETGTHINLCACAFFDVGYINPLYDSGGTACVDRSTGVSGYTFSYQGSPEPFYCTTDLSRCCSFGSVQVIAGNNYVSGCVSYCCGPQPYMSDCITPYCTALSGGFCVSSRNICGLYPWYYGKFCSGGAAAGDNRPSATTIGTIICSGTVGTGCTCNKMVEISTGTIYSLFNSGSDDYIWFATPAASTTKTCWYVDALNKGTIGGGVSPGCNLFPSPETITDVCSHSGCWSGQSYNVYISNYQSISTIEMQLRNS